MISQDRAPILTLLQSRSFLAVLALTLIPAALMSAGLDFTAVTATDTPGADQYQVMRGAIIHTLLEWSSVAFALIIAALAYVHYRITGEMTAPIIGLAMLLSGAMDTFHVLAAMRLIHAAAPDTGFIPFTWALSRSFNAVILLVGTLVALRASHAGANWSPRTLAVMVMVSSLVAIALMIATAMARELPTTQFDDALISRPYDLFPLVVFLGTAPILARLYRRSPNPMTASLLLALLPAIALEIHMAFGSRVLFDSHFNVAHGLKILEYALPFVGVAAEYVRQNSQLVRAREDAILANKAKSAFLANMSHEIRTPLNGVLGMVQALGETPLTAEQTKMLDLVTSSGRNLTDILNSILDLSKMEAGKFELDEQDFPLEDCLQSSIALHRYAATEKTLSLDLEIDENCRGLYRGDALRIRQIIQNLISNAIKFTPSGSITLSAICRPPADGADRSVLELRVSDTGIGIAPEHLGKLFNAFNQGDNSTTRRFGGTGLGLSIIKSLTDLMGGSVRVESELGQGASFTVEIPLIRLESAGLAEPGKPATLAAAPDGTEGPGLADMRVLAVEDVKTNQIVLQALLGARCQTLDLADHGAAAIERWRTLQPDLILMDKHMPVMDGLTAIRAIRAAELQDDLPRTLIIALSADTLSHHVGEMLDAGADAHVAKPINLDLLLATIQSQRTARAA
ncbi:hybrid sensor histidine kinase/response regulator [Maricaulis salignorans]|uniref:Sensory/regulatory protein RpfC n=1 Tax=Maricaulis salignorans TaxID=144026 RepID=A0A1G9PH08_9PROT|nr:ATP-binding protein [Maricaulis salignorans]SDL97497.1 Signal transduction histidine kinase [Maricaulis salignorans]